MKTDLQTQDPGSAPAHARLYYLDWLRVLAILGVVIFHAIHPFDLIVWQIKYPEQSMFITIIILFFNFWGMHLFFLLSGAGSRFALLRRTPRRYAVERDAGETFGNFTVRVGVVKAVIDAAKDFHG